MRYATNNPIINGRLIFIKNIMFILTFIKILFRKE